MTRSRAKKRRDREAAREAAAEPRERRSVSAKGRLATRDLATSHLAMDPSLIDRTSRAMEVRLYERAALREERVISSTTMDGNCDSESGKMKGCVRMGRYMTFPSEKAGTVKREDASEENRNSAAKKNVNTIGKTKWETQTVYNGVPRTMKPAYALPENYIKLQSLKRKLVVITNASEGFGFDIAEAVTEAGGDIVLWSNHKFKAATQKTEGLEEWHNREEYNTRAEALPFNIAEYDCVYSGMESILRGHGPMDVFIANVDLGIHEDEWVSSSLKEAKKKRIEIMKRKKEALKNKSVAKEPAFEDYAKQIRKHVDSVASCAKCVGRSFKVSGSGTFIITTTFNGSFFDVPVDDPVFDCTKVALAHLGRSLARQWQDFARVNVVVPGVSATTTNTMALASGGRSRKTTIDSRENARKRITDIFLDLASDKSSYPTGSELVIEEGAYITVKGGV